VEIVQGCALTIASIAAFIDVYSRRIPNWLTLSAFVVGVAVNAWLHGFGGAGSALLGGALGLLLLLPFYAMRAIGAGDVKLLAAIGAFLGPQLLVTVAVYAAVAGGVLSAVILLRRRRLGLALNEMLIQRRAPSLSGATGPYGVAIASGVVLSLVLPAVLS
jgi:prepilin peptidase CpaA